MSRDYPSHPLVGVGAVVFRGDDVLLIRRGRPPAKGEWHLPGGAQHVGETVAEAAAREVLEETGLTIRVLDIAGVVDLIRRDDAGRVRWHYTIIDVAAEWVAGTAVAGDDAEAVAWAGAEALAGFGITPETARIIALARLKRGRPRAV